jgi:septal ring factor EnvC (AmiA/AmiB activator)
MTTTTHPDRAQSVPLWTKIVGGCAVIGLLFTGADFFIHNSGLVRASEVNVSSLSAQIAEMKKSDDQLRSTIDDVNRTLASLQPQLGGITQTIGDIERQLGEHDSRLRAVEQTTAADHALITDLHQASCQGGRCK